MDLRRLGIEKKNFRTFEHFMLFKTVGAAIFNLLNQINFFLIWANLQLCLGIWYLAGKDRH